MPMQLRLGGAWQQISGAKVFANKSWRSLVAMRVYSGGAWRLVANWTPPSPGGGGGGGGGNLKLTLSPTSFARTSTQDTFSVSLTATPSGGLTPYTYSWTVVTSTTSVTFSAATAATTRASVSGLTPNEPESATLRCTVTDSLGVSTHADVSGTFEQVTL